jgi:hypothetical protein
MNYSQEQQERELHHIKAMSLFQKEVVVMLKKLGFRYKYNKVYQLNDGAMPIDVSYITDIEDLYKLAYKNGAQEKVWEIKRVLEVP